MCLLCQIRAEETIDLRDPLGPRLSSWLQCPVACLTREELESELRSLMLGNVESADKIRAHVNALAARASELERVRHLNECAIRGLSADAAAQRVVLRLRSLSVKKLAKALRDARAEKAAELSISIDDLEALVRLLSCHDKNTRSKISRRRTIARHDKPKH